MPNIETIIQSQFEERRGVEGKALVWVRARNRSTGLPESIGFWSGDDHENFTIDGQSRTYFGAGNVISIPPIRSVAGLKTVYHTITLPPFTDEVRTALLQYDSRLAAVEVHVAAFDIDTGIMMSNPIRMIKGQLQEAPLNIAEKGGRNSSVNLKVASSARRLSLGVPIYRSRDALEARAPTDRGREYIDVAGDWIVPWGET